MKMPLLLRRMGPAASDASVVDRGLAPSTAADVGYDSVSSSADALKRSPPWVLDDLVQPSGESRNVQERDDEGASAFGRMSGCLGRYSRHD